MQWLNVLITELIVIFGLMYGLGFIKLPKFLRQKRLVKGFPWGYYTDSVVKQDPGFFAENNQDFLHDVGTEFAGMDGFGDFGEFSGFGEMGEYGANFSSGGD